MKILDFIPLKFKLFLLPAVVFAAVFILALTAGRWMVNQFFEIRSKISDLTTTNNSLEAKINSLSLIDQDDLNQKVQLATNAVPSENSTLFVLFAVRNFVAEQGVTVSNFTIGGKLGVKEASSVEIFLSAKGSLPSLVSFIDNIQKVSPLMKVKELKISGNRESSSADIKIVSIWNPLPKNLGKIETPIEELKTTEEEILAQLKDLRAPAGTEFSVSLPQGRENPFTF